MEQDICVLIGRRIREHRIERGWRQIDLAAHASISETYVSELETGRSEVCIRTLQAISTALGVKMSILLKSL